MIYYYFDACFCFASFLGRVDLKQALCNLQAQYAGERRWRERAGENAAGGGASPPQYYPLDTPYFYPE